MRKLYFMFFMINLIVFSLGVSTTSSAREVATTIEDHIAVSERVVEELWNDVNLDSVSELYQLPFIDHAFTINEPISWTPIAWSNTVLRMYHRAFPDLEIRVENIMAIDDIVVVQYSAHGTHEGDFANVGGVRIAPSGKLLTWDGVWMLRFEQGKIVEQWAYSNNPVVQQSGYGNTID